MSESTKISLRDAILINLNVMFGTGVFINTVNLSKRAGALGFLSYLTVAIIMLPLILAIAQMVRLHPVGGFYAYAAHDIAPFVGFFSAWAYFVGKLASVSLLIHVFSTLLQSIVPQLASINTLIIDGIILIIFTWLNRYNLKTGTKITAVFIILKFTPILFAILSSIYLFNIWSLPADTFYWNQIPATLPLVLYAFVGFEVACSISSSIQDADQNAPKAILYSFLMAVGITLLYQGVLFATIGTQLMQLNNFTGVFPTLLANLFPNHPSWLIHLGNMLNIAVASSALGGSYGILLSNAWNLYTLAENKQIIGYNFFRKLNKFGIPGACILVEAIICVGYFIMTWGNQIALQQVSVLGCTIAYTCSVLGLLKIDIKNKIGWLALVGCVLLFSTCISNFLSHDTVQLLFFISLLVIGLILSVLQQVTKKI